MRSKKRTLILDLFCLSVFGLMVLGPELLIQGCASYKSDVGHFHTAGTNRAQQCRQQCAVASCDRSLGPCSQAECVSECLNE